MKDVLKKWWEKFISNKWGWRVFMLGLGVALPFYWLCVACADLWETDPIPEVYEGWWKSFKKGAAL